MPSGLFCLNYLDSNLQVNGCLLSFIYRNSFNANSEDAVQMPQSVTSDLGLHYLQRFRLWDDRLKWVNLSTYFFNNFPFR